MIFKQLLSGRQFSSFVLIKDNPNHTAHHLLLKIIKDNLERKNTVHLFNYESPNLSQYEEFLSTATFISHNCYHDNWDLKLGRGYDNYQQPGATPKIMKAEMVQFECIWIDPGSNGNGKGLVTVIKWRLGRCPKDRAMVERVD